jgi:prepilin signal peptidase PulO-like enzyme (type II secretory pathway)
VVLLFWLGLCMGSFVNALVWRMKKNKDWVRERSVCVNCKHVLAARDLIPVISWVSLRGKCRYCHKPISPQYPLVELLTALLFIISYLLWPLAGVEGIASLSLWLILIVILVALSVYDIKYMLLPNKLVTAAGIVTVGYILARTALSGDSFGVIIGSGLGLLSFGGLFWVLYQISDGKWIGGGDVKLGFVLGAWLGSISLSLLAIFVASLVGSLIAVILLALKRANSPRVYPLGRCLFSDL